MPTLRKLMMTSTDEVALDEAHAVWIQKPGMREDVEKLEKMMLQYTSNPFYTRPDVLWKQLLQINSLPWKPETLYHVGRSLNWDAEKFPIPVKAAMKYLTLFAHLVEHGSRLPQVDLRSIPAAHVRWLLNYDGDLRKKGRFGSPHEPDLEALCLNEHMGEDDVEQFMGKHGLDFGNLSRHQPLTELVKELLFKRLETKVDEDMHPALLGGLLQNLIRSQKSLPASKAVPEMRRLLDISKDSDIWLTHRIASDYRCPTSMVLEMMESEVLASPPHRAYSVETLERFVKFGGAFAVYAYGQPGVAHLLPSLVEDDPADLDAHVVTALAGNRALPEPVLVWFSRHSRGDVRRLAASHVGVPARLAEVLSEDRAVQVRRAVASNKQVPVGCRFQAFPSEKFALQLLNTRREEFLDWVNGRWPELDGLPDQFLAPVLTTVVAQEMLERRKNRQGRSGKTA